MTTHELEALTYKRIPGYERYEVSSEGAVRRDGKELKQEKNAKGYPRVCLSRNGAHKKYSVHSLVLLAFIGPLPSGLERRHLNDIKSDNRIKNLCYGTRAENDTDKIRHGATTAGHKNNTAKLTWEKVGEIRRDYRPRNARELAVRYGVHYSTIINVVKNVTWRTGG